MQFIGFMSGLRSSDQRKDQVRPNSRRTVARLPIFTTVTSSANTSIRSNRSTVSVNSTMSSRSVISAKAATKPKTNLPATSTVTKAPPESKFAIPTAKPAASKIQPRKTFYALGSTSETTATKKLSSTIRPSTIPIASTPSSATTTKAFVASSSMPARPLLSASSSSVVGFSDAKLQCKFCDRKFEKPFALENHLQMNCSKIPPSERRKIFSENKSNNQIKATTSQGSTLNGKSVVKKSTIGMAFNSKRLTRLLTDLNSELQSNGSQSNDDLPEFKSLGHTGIYRTPSKKLICKVCNKTFINCVKYADHCMQH